MMKRGITFDGLTDDPTFAITALVKTANPTIAATRVELTPPMRSQDSKQSGFCRLMEETPVQTVTAGPQPLGATDPTADRDRVAAERDSLPLISGSPVFNTAACHSVSTSRVAEQIKSHLRAWTGTIRRCVKLPDSKLNYFRRKYRAAPNHLTFASFLATDPRWQWRRRKSTY
ncbi:hypothetical protein EYF80_017394 [Liparis tanakae]|uniref:Uncharacterized protein n=1 Tax=Liparis tanakae TaxID=230148 RepID=A0A4Z2I4I2_9TELE|nr:hypothetical protein EYF80_017394 [Liparis tanakae]